MAKRVGSLPSLDVVFGETKAAVERQSEEISSLDMKLGVLLGLAGIILAALLGFLFNPQCGDLATKGFITLAVVLVLASLICAALGYRTRKYEIAPAPKELRKFYLMEDLKKTKLVLLDTLVKVYYRNKKRIETKVRYTNISFIFVFSGALMIGVTLLYSLFRLLCYN
jgi:hypothetical protein